MILRILNFVIAFLFLNIIENVKVIRFNYFILYMDVLIMYCSWKNETYGIIDH